jgi:hypothetical protein
VEIREIIFSFPVFIIWILLTPFSLNVKTNTFSLGSFESALPTTTRERANSILVYKIKCLLVCVLIFSLGYILLFLLAKFSVNAAFILELKKEFLEPLTIDTGKRGYENIIYHVLFISIYLWIMIAMGYCLWLTGKFRVWMVALYLPIAMIFITVIILGSFLYPWIAGSVIMPGIIFCFIRAFKKDLLRTKDVLGHLGLWAGVSLAWWGYLYFRNRSLLPELGVIISVGIAVALTPFALAPLALHWNRHR